MRWSYGITTVEKRRKDLLPRTIQSLKLGGFDKPRLFVDGSNDPISWSQEFELEVTTRYPVIRAYANWMLALGELYAREPLADRYCMFQDDFVTYPNLRQYLETVPYPTKGYWNLMTTPSTGVFPGRLGRDYTGWYKSNQLGRGAVALIFDRTTVQKLLSLRYMIMRPEDPRRGWKVIDGGIIDGLKPEGWTEYVHSPSLVRHTGIESTIDKRKNVTFHDPNHPTYLWPKYYDTSTFRGEDFDALQLIKTI